MDSRPEFIRMLADCEAGKIDIILTKSLSRFARNTVDTLNVVRRLKELGIEVRFEKERINSLADEGELLITIMASFAQEEVRSLSENVIKWGLRKRFEQGCECQRKSEPSANQYLSHLCERILEPPTPKVTANT